MAYCKTELLVHIPEFKGIDPWVKFILNFWISLFHGTSLVSQRQAFKSNTHTSQSYSSFKSFNKLSNLFSPSPAVIPKPIATLMYAVSNSYFCSAAPHSCSGGQGFLGYERTAAFSSSSRWLRGADAERHYFKIPRASFPFGVRLFLVWLEFSSLALCNEIVSWRLLEFSFRE